MVPKPLQKSINASGLELVYFEWGKLTDETILMVHATGFHARCWDQVVNCLEDHHVIALDMRGHGRSPKTGPYTWKTFGDDVIEFIETLDLRNIVGVGHSMGGHSLTRAAANSPERFRRLLLVDPVILSPELYRVPEIMKNAFPDGHPVARRKNYFANAQAMYDNFQGRGSYASWTHSALMDYCQYGLEAEGDGFKLACPPEVEASIYLGNSGNDVHHLLPEINIPVTVMRARERTGMEEGVMDFSLSPTWPQLVSEFPQGKEIYLPDMTHFIPMQNPQLVADCIKAGKAG